MSPGICRVSDRSSNSGVFCKTSLLFCFFKDTKSRKEKLEQVASFSLFGNVMSMASVQLVGASRDALLLSFKDAKVCRTPVLTPALTSRTRDSDSDSDCSQTLKLMSMIEHQFTDFTVKTTKYQWVAYD